MQLDLPGSISACICSQARSNWPQRLRQSTKAFIDEVVALRPKFGSCSWKSKASEYVFAQRGRSKRFWNLQQVSCSWNRDYLPKAWRLKKLEDCFIISLLGLPGLVGLRSKLILVGLYPLQSSSCLQGRSMNALDTAAQVTTKYKCTVQCTYETML